ncbi:MAG: ATP-binding protein [Armatimonadetes bacterium]|nr:ATP-binding protein [Armatimonadota bacterium]
MIGIIYELLMDEIALHILDIAMNAVTAGARRLEIAVHEDHERDRLEVRVADDGKGMDAEQLRRVLEQFASDKSGRRHPIGLGLALLEQTAEACGGQMRVASRPGRGTEVAAWMRLSHVDRPPLGDLKDTVFALCVGAPDVDMALTYRRNGWTARFGSAAVRRELGPGQSLQSPVGLRAVRRALLGVPDS